MVTEDFLPPPGEPLGLAGRFLRLESVARRRLGVFVALDLFVRVTAGS
jgi:hypothetical protein